MIKTLVATGRSQGRRLNDFNWCIEGELVCLGGICDDAEADVESECGCGRAFYGLNSHEGTTTAVVAEVPLTREEYIEAHRSSFEAQYKPTASAAVEADGMIEMVEDWSPGTVVERRGWDFVVRNPPRIRWLQVTLEDD